MHRILIGGFGWSGSGAVIDMLSQYEGIGYVRKGFEETSFLKGRFSVTGLYARSLLGEELTKADFCDMYGGISSLNALIHSEIPDTEKFNLMRNKLLHYEMGADLVSLTHDLFVEGCAILDESPPPKKVAAWFETRLPKFFDRFTEALPAKNFNGESRIALFNNDPSGYNTNFAKLLKPELSILVYRDPRDIFASHVKGKRHENTPGSARIFYQRHRRIFRTFRERVNAGVFEPNTSLLDFDDFVIEESVRDNIVALIPGLGEKVQDTYEVERSLKNVGLRNKLDIGEDLGPQMALIEENILTEWRDTMESCADILHTAGGHKVS